jgi:hypothetical protein
MLPSVYPFLCCQVFRIIRSQKVSFSSWRLVHILGYKTKAEWGSDLTKFLRADKAKREEKIRENK